MNVLLDTNILGRMAEAGHPQHRVALDATDALRKRGDIPCVVPQILYEFWVVATRPAVQNGLGFSAVQAGTELARIERIFPLLPETAAVYVEWRRLVTSLQITGKPAHDARIVAAMTVHGVSQILTFNTGDFARYPRITALEPAAVASPPTA
jgi:predicted nucleic acid-binding protein